MKNRIKHGYATDAHGNVIITTPKAVVKFCSEDALFVRIGKYEYYIDNSTGENILQKSKIDSTKVISTAKRGRPKIWGLAEEQQLRELFPITPNKHLADVFNTSQLAITSKANDMGLKKSDRYWKEEEINTLISLHGIMSDREVGIKLGKPRYGVVEMKRKLRAVGRLPAIS